MAITGYSGDCRYMPDIGQFRLRIRRLEVRIPPSAPMSCRSERLMDEERCSEQDRVALVKLDLSSIGTTQGGDKRRFAAGRSDRDRASKIEEVRDASQYGVVTL